MFMVHTWQVRDLSLNLGLSYFSGRYPRQAPKYYGIILFEQYDMAGETNRNTQKSS